jgi:hypothetical protein
MDLDTQPQTFTVEEAARILRIGRTTADALAREWRATRGRSGLPVLELGRSLRVPRSALAELLATPAVPGAGSAAHSPAAPYPTRQCRRPAVAGDAVAGQCDHRLTMSGLRRLGIQQLAVGVDRSPHGTHVDDPRPR